MAIRSRRGEAEPRLDPVRWRLPHRGAVVRAGLTAALLLTAVAALYAREPAGTADAVPTPAPAAAGAPPPGSRTPASSLPGFAPAGSAGPGLGGSGHDGARGWLAVPGDRVGVPVRLVEPATLAVVRPGDRVDLLAAPAGRQATPITIAADALVLGVTADADGLPGAALYLALTRAEAERVVGAPEQARFAALVRP